MLRARGLCVHYGDHCALHDVDLDIPRGQFVGVVGPNGGGKSTLARAVLGLLPSAHGALQVDGRVAYVPQDAVHADANMPISVREFVAMGRIGRRFWRRQRAQDARLVDKALLETGMLEHAKRRLSHMSGGQRQRAYVSKALAQEADLLVLDEPTTGVDPDTRDRIHQLLRHLCRDHGLTVLMVSHDTDSLVDHADRIIVLDQAILHDGPATTYRQWSRTRAPADDDPFGAHGGSA